MHCFDLSSSLDLSVFNFSKTSSSQVTWFVYQFYLLVYFFDFLNVLTFKSQLPKYNKINFYLYTFRQFQIIEIQFWKVETFKDIVFKSLEEVEFFKRETNWEEEYGETIYFGESDFSKLVQWKKV